MSKRKRMDLHMRRDPGSEEGRRIVRSILEAAEKLLQSERYAELSSNRIAEAAGVSVGSFYQYFPNKESVIAELARALEQRALQLLSARVDKLEQASVAEAVHAFVDVLFDARMGGLNMRRQLLEQVPRDWFGEASRRVDSEVKALVCEFLGARSAEVAVHDAELATFVLFHTVEAVVEAAVAARPTAIEDGSLRRELTKLVSSYLGCASAQSDEPAAPELSCDRPLAPARRIWPPALAGAWETPDSRAPARAGRPLSTAASDPEA